MRLSEYLEQTGTAYAEFGRRIGVKSRSTVARYASGKRVPSPKIMPRIFKATGGQVTANDFFADQQPAQAA